LFCSNITAWNSIYRTYKADSTYSSTKKVNGYSKHNYSVYNYNIQRGKTLLENISDMLIVRKTAYDNAVA